MKQSSTVRKISIGSDYKDKAMHYSIGQKVWGDHTISNIIHNEEDNSYDIFITKNSEIVPWKKFNRNMAISVEYDLNYGE
jgi:hypothetical protein